jgi:hypothetical protein
LRGSLLFVVLQAVHENTGLVRLNLAWNGISAKGSDSERACERASLLTSIARAASFAPFLPLYLCPRFACLPRWCAFLARIHGPDTNGSLI